MKNQSGMVKGTRQLQKPFDVNCLYITENECRLKHYLSVNFLKEYFAAQDLNVEEYMQKVYEYIELSDSLNDYMIYIELEQNTAKELVMEMDKTAPCFILLKKGHQYEPEAYYFIFYAISNVKKINKYLERFGFYKVDISGYFGGTPDEDAQEQAGSEASTDTSNTQEIPLKSTVTPLVADSVVNQATIENALHSGILTLPNNIYTLPKSVQEQIRKNNLKTTKVVMTENEWKKHGYAVTNSTTPLYLKNVPNAPEYLPLYNQTHVSNAIDSTPTNEVERNAALQKSTLQLQQIIRNDIIMRDTMLRNQANIDNTTEYTPENTQNKTAYELTSMIFTMVPAYILMNSGEIQQQIGQYQSLAENSVKRVLLDTLSPVLGAENALQPMQDAIPDTKTIASEISKAGIPITALLGVISKAAQTIATTIKTELNTQREQTITIEKAKTILQDIPDETKEKEPLLNINTYRNKSGEISLSITAAKTILEVFQKLTRTHENTLNAGTSR